MILPVMIGPHQGERGAAAELRSEEAAVQRVLEDTLPTAPEEAVDECVDAVRCFCAAAKKSGT